MDGLMNSIRSSFAAGLQRSRRRRRCPLLVRMKNMDVLEDSTRSILAAVLDTTFYYDNGCRR